MTNFKSKTALLLGTIFLLSGCTTKNSVDPLENYNRGMYAINKGFDKVFIKPAAYIYDGAVPKPLKCMVGNFFQNLRTIPTLINDILQANGKEACNDAARLIINSTLGIAGLFDVAAKAGLERRYIDFGLTLGRWGYKDSTYIVLPFFGPSTIRDTIGLVGTYYMSVWPYFRNIRHHHKRAIALRNWLLVADVLDTRVGLLGTEKILETAAVDEYTLVRDAYIQHRNYDIATGASASNTGPGPISTDILPEPPE